MIKHISYTQWVNNVILHTINNDGTVVYPCPECKNIVDTDLWEYDYDPICCECGGVGIVVYDEHGDKINISKSAYSRQYEIDEISWYKNMKKPHEVK